MSKSSKSKKIPALIAIVAAVALSTALLIPAESKPPADFYTYETDVRYPIELDLPAMPEQQASSSNDNELQWKTHTIASGESMAIVFQKVGLSARTLHFLVNSDEGTQSLVKLRPGVKLQFGLDDEGKLQQLRQRKSSTDTFIVDRIDDTTFASRTESRNIDTQLNFAQAEITSSFWNAGIAAGLTPNQIMEIATLFGWDIDFALDIRAGDSFRVMFEERWSEGEYMGRGNILAAQFTNLGDTFTAIRAANGDYYDQEGRAMKKAFLRAPLDFRRVSSNFNPRRLHPVTGQVRPHRGTDYVAPVGTPIWAAGNGVVSESGYNKYNGNYVFIRHSATYMTKYLHLKKRMVRAGDRVRQGDTIGTLGATGRVTGAHLHYEFLVNGVHKNPRTVELPKSESLEGEEHTVFLRHAQNQLAQLGHFNELLAGNLMLIDGLTVAN
ncbi:peptidoglycan DD-metalloendopeptidase family protein [Thaumasiovibrio subtropicus]|uniref:peptidoglycan DD-metalloendopeptidase family protein n=1 Tax=Thaumasiovibrio subtropicus TaxID=1891207 RepID=UPI000B35E0F4|nr:peptidoglycan DD-metalloendopeptidase family protein [Thaumasiovibrio subtropicus]